MREEFERQIMMGKKNCQRGGPIMPRILYNSAVQIERKLSGKDAMTLCDTYGLSPKQLMVLLYSHNLSVDEEAFIEELVKDEERKKSTVNLLARHEHNEIRI